MLINKDIGNSLAESNKVNRLTELYIYAKRNPKEILGEEASEWRNYVCEPTPYDPYKVSLPFPEAYEKYILPELPNKRREYLRMIIERIPEGKTTAIVKSARYATAEEEEEELVLTAIDHKLLLERLDKLEIEVAMLKSQNAFADVAGK